MIIPLFITNSISNGCYNSTCQIFNNTINCICNTISSPLSAWIKISLLSILGILVIILFYCFWMIVKD
jgi:hypothetical protein